MKEIKACFFDFDGTLRDFETGKVPESTLKAFEIMKEKGIKIFMSTGRHPYSINFFKKYYDFDGYVVDNGAYIVYNDEVIYKKPIEKEDVKNTLKWLKTNPLQVEFHTKDITYMNLDNEYTRRMVEIGPQFEMLFEIVDDETILNTEVIEMSFHGTAEQEKELFKVCPNLKSERWIPDFTDINTIGTSKAQGCHLMMDKFNLKNDEVLSFGDGGNDISMLDNVGIGVVMGNADDNVKKHGKYITDHINNDGVYKALKHFNVI